MVDSSDTGLVGDTNEDGVVDSNDATLSPVLVGDEEVGDDGDGNVVCPEGTVPNDGTDTSTNLLCISGAPGTFSGVVYAGVLGVAVAAGLLVL